MPFVPAEGDSPSWFRNLRQDRLITGTFVGTAMWPTHKAYALLSFSFLVTPCLEYCLPPYG